MQKLPHIHETVDALILRSMRHPGRLQEGVQLEDIYEARLWFQLVILRELDAEIRHTLSRFPRVKTIFQYSVLTKLYVISWVTISDVLAAVLNETFELGISDKDLNLSMVLRNRHLNKTPINKIKQQYSAVLRHENFKTIRNDIVHRGKLSIPEYLALRAQHNTLAVVEMIDPERSKKEMRHYLLGLTALRLDTAQKFREHYKMTVEMLNEVFSVLHDVVAEKIRDRGELTTQEQRKLL